MRSNSIKWITLILLIVLIGGFYVYRVYTSSFKNIKFENIDKALSNVDYEILYLGEIDDNKKDLLKETIKDTRIQVNSTNPETLDEVNEYLKKYDLEVKSMNYYILMTNGEVNAVISAKEENWRFKELVRWYFFNEIPASEIAYKMPETVEDYEKIINKKNYNVTVLGYASCTYCNLYMPKVNNLASKYGIDIYYFDRDKDINLFEDVRDLGLEIPAKCTKDGVATTTNATFAKPMTLITKNGKTVDCIKGDVKEEELEAMLRKYKIIKEKK